MLWDARSKFLRRGIIWSWFFWARYNFKVSSWLVGIRGSCIWWFGILWIFPKRSEFIWTIVIILWAFWVNFDRSLMISRCPAWNITNFYENWFILWTNLVIWIPYPKRGNRIVKRQMEKLIKRKELIKWER